MSILARQSPVGSLFKVINQSVKLYWGSKDLCHIILCLVAFHADLIVKSLPLLEFQMRASVLSVLDGMQRRIIVASRLRKGSFDLRERFKPTETKKH